MFLICRVGAKYGMCYRWPASTSPYSLSLPSPWSVLFLSVDRSLARSSQKPPDGPRSSPPFYACLSSWLCRKRSSGTSARRQGSALSGARLTTSTSSGTGPQIWSCSELSQLLRSFSMYVFWNRFILWADFSLQARLYTGTWAPGAPPQQLR